MQSFVNILCSQARSQGDNGGNSSPIPKVAPKIFRIIKLLMCKPKKYFSTNQQNCGTCPTSTFGRTWSKQYGSPIAHD